MAVCGRKRWTFCAAAALLGTVLLMYIGPSRDLGNSVLGVSPLEENSKAKGQETTAFRNIQTIVKNERSGESGFLAAKDEAATGFRVTGKEDGIEDLSGYLSTELQDPDVALVTTVASDTTVLLRTPLPPTASGREIDANLKIPRIIHQQWDTNKVPRKFAKYIQSWSKMHPGWDYVFWTPADIRNLLRNYYPRGFAQYEKETTILMKTDIMRWYIIHKLGGIYLDLDMECLRPFDSWRDKEYCFITENAHEHSMMLDKKTRPTALMPIAGCRHGHPFYELAMKMLDVKFPKLTFMEKHFFTDMVFVEYNKTQASKNSSEQIVMVEPGMFLSIVDPDQFPGIKSTCMSVRRFDSLASVQKRVCLELKDRHYENKIRPYSYSVHYWEHFIFWNQKRKEADSVSIYDIVPTAKNATEYLKSLDVNFSTNPSVKKLQSIGLRSINSVHSIRDGINSIHNLNRIKNI